MNLSEFFYMGGYAAFLWPAYALVMSVLVYNRWAARRAHQEARRAAARRLQMEETRS
jgi:heme exporter protein CcmD